MQAAELKYRYNLRDRVSQMKRNVYICNLIDMTQKVDRQ
mgnify:CR=1 FL=1